MTRRKRPTGQDRHVKLSSDNLGEVAPRLIAAAQAHQRVSELCRGQHINPSNNDYVYFLVVSFELILLSVEQSLRLLLLLQYRIVRDDTNHNPGVLYKTLKNKDRDKPGLRKVIIDRMNSLGHLRGIEPFSEKELDSCLRRHDSTYTPLRYFYLTHRAGVIEKFAFTPRDRQVMHCFGLALVQLNGSEMARRGIGTLQFSHAVPHIRDAKRSEGAIWAHAFLKRQQFRLYKDGDW